MDKLRLPWKMKYSLAIGHEMGLIGKRKWLSQWHSQAVGEGMRLPGERNRVSLTSCWIKMSWYHCPEQKDCHSHPGKRWDYLAVREGSLSQPELVIEWDGSLNAFLATKDGGNVTHWLVAKDEMQQAVPSVTTYSLWKLWCWSLQEMWLRLKKGSMTVLPVLTYCWSLDEICDETEKLVVSLTYYWSWNMISSDYLAEKMAMSLTSCWCGMPCVRWDCPLVWEGKKEYHSLAVGMKCVKMSSRGRGVLCTRRWSWDEMRWDCLRQVAVWLLTCCCYGMWCKENA